MKAIIGGNGSGKTMAAFVECLAVFTGIVPDSLVGEFPVDEIDWTRPRHVAVIVRDFKDHWNDVFKPLMFGEDVGMLPKSLHGRWDGNDHRIEGEDGSTLVFMAMKNNEDSRQGRGSAKHWVQIDEECSEYTYNEMRARTMRREGRLVMSMCPQSGFTWAYDRIWLATHDKDNEPLPEDKCSAEIFCVRTEIHDNPTLNPRAVAAFIADLPPHERRAREKGLFSTPMGKTAFDFAVLSAWENDGKLWREGTWYDVVQPRQQGTVWEATFKPVSRFGREGQPLLEVWEPPKPDRLYLGWADQSAGYEDSDPQCFDVWDVTGQGPELDEAGHVVGSERDIRMRASKWVQVAQLHCRLPTTEYTDICLAVCHWYGDCMFVPEANEHGLVAIERAKPYGNMYVQRLMGGAREHDTERYGWRTDRNSKPLMVQTMREMLLMWASMGWCPFRSRKTLDELLSYEEIPHETVGGGRGTSYRAMPGHYDDRCMVAMGVAATTNVVKNNLTPGLRCRKIRHRQQDWSPMGGIVAKSDTRRRLFERCQPAPRLTLIVGANRQKKLA
ncbi:MAG: terminase family protein [Acidobacteriota bacterium]